MKWNIKPITWRAACDFVNQYHRHNKDTVGCKFSIGLYDGETLVGYQSFCHLPICGHAPEGKGIRMAGRKRTPCELCEGEKWYSEEKCTGNQLAVEISPDTNMIGITSFVNRESGEGETLKVTIEMNFCPVCGRKLGY